MNASATVLDALSDGRPRSTVELVSLGASRATLHRLEKAGLIERGARGVYRRSESTGTDHQDWAALSLRVPSAVFCLTSAAVFHRMTQDMPSAIDIAVPRNVGRVSGGTGHSFPVDIAVMHWRNPAAFEEGVETREIDGVPVRVTSPERTIVDLFRFSSLNPSCREPRIGSETVVECIHRALDPQDGIADAEKLDVLARAFGVDAALKPYLVSYNFAVNNGYRA